MLMTNLTNQQQKEEEKRDKQTDKREPNEATKHDPVNRLTKTETDT